MILKICGLKNPELVPLADTADYVGFVMGSPHSRRNITPSQFKKCVEHIDNAQSVIVTANGDPRTIEKLDRLGADVIQLHGDARSFKDSLNTPYAIGASPNEEVDDPEARYVVLDTLDQRGYGGSGMSWNWRKLQSFSSPVLIAGGITVQNFREALQVTGAQGIDLSSSLEIRGEKSARLIADLLKEVGRI